MRPNWSSTRCCSTSGGRPVAPVTSMRFSGWRGQTRKITATPPGVVSAATTVLSASNVSRLASARSVDETSCWRSGCPTTTVTTWRSAATVLGCPSTSMRTSVTVFPRKVSAGSCADARAGAEEEHAQAGGQADEGRAHQKT